MRIIHVLNELRYSGAELLLLSGAPQIIGDDDHTVLSTGHAIGEFASELEDAGYKLVHLPFSKSARYFWRFTALMRKYDLVHVHAERANFWHAMLARVAGKPCVRTVHNEFVFNGYLRHRRSIGRRLLATVGVRHIACSARVARNELMRFGITAPVIENWLDPRRISRATRQSRSDARSRLRMPEDAFILVSIGNYGPAKNQEAIVEAVRDCAVDLPILYYHCGSGGAELRARMKIGVDEPIHMQGTVANIGDILVAADAFIAASFNEGGQVSLLEAAATGIPCITTIVGLAESLVDLPGIVRVEPNSQSVADGVRLVWASKAKHGAEFCSELSEYVLTRYVPEVGARRYSDLYQSLARNWRAKA